MKPLAQPEYLRLLTSSPTNVGWGDKLLGLLPKLRGPSGRAPSESEKAVLQNAVTATDQQIDALIYELYGLTPEEIKLVEGHQ
jgi:hypothetical protein